MRIHENKLIAEYTSCGFKRMQKRKMNELSKVFT